MTATALQKFVASTGNPLAIPDNEVAGQQLTELAAAATAGGVPLLRFTQDGEWVYGQDSTPIESSVAIAIPSTMQRGFVAWHQSKIADEFMESVFSLTPTPKEELAPPSAGAWEGQLSMKFMIEDLSIESMYKISNRGGKERLAELGGRLAAARAKNPAVALIEVDLGGDSYMNKTYGTEIFKPVFKVLRWLDVDGNEVVIDKKGKAKQELL